MSLALGTLRRLPPVYSHIEPGALLAAAGAQLHQAPAKSGALELAYPGRSIVLTDSGTSALSLALAAASRRSGGTLVALPAYCCPDVGSAALGAKCRIVLYDVDPHTLAPDVPSLQAALKAGASMVVVAHLLGRIIDVPAIQELALPFNAVVIEDAAQHAGGMLRGVRAGMFGDYAVLSFGRGKGLNAGGGGALLAAQNEALPSPVASATKAASLKALAAAVAGELMVHPRVYWLPAMIPQLKLGETVYHAPTPASGMTATSITLLEAALAQETATLRIRRANEAWYQQALINCPDMLLAEPSPDVQAGALRFPILIAPDAAAPLGQLGVARSYPRLLRDYPEIASHCVNADAVFDGASVLAHRLHTLPTHTLITPADRQRIVAGVMKSRAVDR